MNYEIEIEQTLFDNLQKKFHLKDPVLTYLYLKYRTFCIYKDYNFKDKFLLIKTLFDELFIHEYSYKGYMINFYYARENSLSNIIDNMEFELTKTSYNEIYDKTNILNQIIEYKNFNLKKYRQDSYFDKYETYFMLKKLNEIFKISEIEEVPNIDGYKQYDERINKELECERYLHFANFNTDNLGSIQEKDLEDYLINNLDKIEEGLKYITRQLELGEGRIDILALDKNDNYVIIELKIAIDKSLIWQCMYYPDELKILYKTRKVRMITIAPEYPTYILNPLKKIKNIESYRYNISISNHKVQNIKMYKVL